MSVIASPVRKPRRWLHLWPLALFLLLAIFGSLWLWQAWPQVLMKSIIWQRELNQQMSGLLQEMDAALARTDGQAYLGQSETLLMLMRQHNMKEENILYPMSDQALAEQVAAHGVVAGALVVVVAVADADVLDRVGVQRDHQGARADADLEHVAVQVPQLAHQPEQAARAGAVDEAQRARSGGGARRGGGGLRRRHACRVTRGRCGGGASAA